MPRFCDVRVRVVEFDPEVGAVELAGVGVGSARVMGVVSRHDATSRQNNAAIHGRTSLTDSIVTLEFRALYQMLATPRA
jgi:hypothetical protein